MWIWDYVGACSVELTLYNYVVAVGAYVDMGLCGCLLCGVDIIQLFSSSGCLLCGNDIIQLCKSVFMRTAEQVGHSLPILTCMA